ncbi:STAS domain-containing protein [Vibrio anguillarum]|uniref:STAS domain-containing protein n=1 Tax=Vibrio anguillarum TaxID=55601 RepID=UPI0018FED701|nr:lipid asymmetry maintenance protein MlaB [Vibrio anguillarum]MBF4425188.1 STAS domain-containing protein [Vibrio anguillarum]
MIHPQWHQTDIPIAALSGALDREHVPDLWVFIQKWNPVSTQFEIELKNVERIDSAGMVMLIHLIEHAKKRNCHIMLSFVPEQLRTLFQLSNIDRLMAQHIKN